MAKVSIIVPVYNVEKYIEKCLDSLVNQTLKDIEIIVVNDGSPDNSEKLIKPYLNKHKNIKYYKKTNGGLSDARNYGLKYATGEYIAFVDSDDYVERAMYEKMYEKAKNDKLDLVICDLDYVLGDGSYLSEVRSNQRNNLNHEEIKKYMIYIYPAAWNKLYSKELFKNDIRFKKGVWYEDTEFIHRLIPFINSLGFVNEKLYHYVQRPGAITKTFDSRLYHYIDNFNGIIDFYKDNNLYNEYEKELEYTYVRYLYGTFVKQATNYRDKKEYKKAVEAAIENVKGHFPKYRRNSYFYKSLKGLYLILFNKSMASLLYLLNGSHRK